MTTPWEQIESDERRKRKREEKDEERSKKRREREEEAYRKAGGSYQWLPQPRREIEREAANKWILCAREVAAAEAEKVRRAAPPVGRDQPTKAPPPPDPPPRCTKTFAEFASSSGSGG